MNPALLRFSILLAAGFLGAAATGKLVPHARWLTETYDISLGLAGFTISAVMLPGAMLSVPLGVVTDRLGARTVAIAGLVVGALASMALGLASASFPFLIALRLVEGFGYCLLAVGATVLVVDTATPSYRTLALSVWSSFAPIGFALGQWAAASATGPERLSAIGIGHGLLMLFVAQLAFLVLPAPPPHDRTRPQASMLEAVRHPPALFASLAFGCVTGILLAAVAVAPLVLARLQGMPVADAAGLTALAALPGIAGRFGAGWLLGRRLTPAAVLLTSGISGAIAIAVVLVADLPLLPALGVFTLFQILMGVIPGVLSAMIPHVAPARDRIGAVSGLVNQMVTLGNLLGPPLVLAIYASTDAAGAAIMLAAWTMLCVALVAHLAVFRKPVASG